MNEIKEERDLITFRCRQYAEMARQLQKEFNENDEYFTIQMCWEMVKTALNENDNELLRLKIDDLEATIIKIKGM